MTESQWSEIEKLARKAKLIPFGAGKVVHSPLPSQRTGSEEDRIDHLCQTDPGKFARIFLTPYAFTLIDGSERIVSLGTCSRCRMVLLKERQS